MANNKREPKSRSQKAKHGGQAAREKYGPEFYSKIGKKGGETVKEKRGSQFYAEIGKKGGESTKRHQGSEFYSKIGKKGGEVVRAGGSSLVEERPSSISNKVVVDRLDPNWDETFYSNQKSSQEEQVPSPSVEGANAGLAISSILTIRITEEPLTAQNFTTVMSALTQLYTKCWLIAKGRFADLIEYTQTNDLRFDEETHLIIAKLTHNSPAEITLTQGTPPDTKSMIDSPVKVNVNIDASPKGVMEALGTAIDALVQAPLRYKEKKLGTEARELAMKLRELETLSDLTDKEQARQIGAQKAELEKQIMLFEIEEKQLVIEKQRLTLQEQRLELEKKRVDYALETANKMVNLLNPSTDVGTKAILAQTLLSNLLELGNGKGLELALPSPKNDKEETTNKEI